MKKRCPFEMSCRGPRGRKAKPRAVCVYTFFAPSRIFPPGGNVSLQNVRLPHTPRPRMNRTEISTECRTKVIKLLQRAVKIAGNRGINKLKRGISGGKRKELSLSQFAYISWKRENKKTTSRPLLHVIVNALDHRPALEREEEFSSHSKRGTSG